MLLELSDMFNPFRKILHRKDGDYDDVRSHVLGERFEPVDDFPPPPPGRYGSADDFSQKTRDVFEPFPMQNAPPVNRPDLSLQETDLGKTAEKTSRDYEIMDRLDTMESQLAIIRSQTETINERLKNLEAKLNLQQRRY